MTLLELEEYFKDVAVRLLGHTDRVRRFAIYDDDEIAEGLRTTLDMTGFCLLLGKYGVSRNSGNDIFRKTKQFNFLVVKDKGRSGNHRAELEIQAQAEAIADKIWAKIIYDQRAPQDWTVPVPGVNPIRDVEIGRSAGEFVKGLFSGGAAGIFVEVTLIEGISPAATYNPADWL